MAYCTKCGSFVEDGALVCPLCGSAQGANFDVNPYSVGASYVGGASGGYADPEAPSIPGFGEAISICFRKYVSFQGRASRSEYWYWALFMVLTSWIPLMSLVCLLPQISVFVRRMHDIGRTGWWWWLPNIALFAFGFMQAYQEETGGDVSAPFVICCIIAFAALIYTIVLLATPGEPGANKYGPAPVRR